MEGSDALETHDHATLPKGLDEMPGTFADGIDNIEYLKDPTLAPDSAATATDTDAANAASTDASGADAADTNGPDADPTTNP